MDRSGRARRGGRAGRIALAAWACVGALVACSSGDGSTGQAASTPTSAASTTGPSVSASVATTPDSVETSTVTTDGMGTSHSAAASSPAPATVVTDPPTTSSAPTTSPTTVPPPTAPPVSDTGQPTDVTAPVTNASVPVSTPGVDSPPNTVAASPDRPYSVFVPSGYDPSTPAPLVVLLHGYTANGLVQTAYFGLQPLAESRGFLLVAPDGTLDQRGQRFWNATDACCDLFGTGVDDSAYLSDVIAEVAADYEVDPRRVFMIGHSNGGFMSYRMACDHADVVAAIVSVAGATFADPGRCAPSQPVSVLEVHGTADATIEYDGDAILGRAYPSAPQSAETWAAYDGCGGAATPTDRVLDLVSNLDGAETTTESFAGCPAGVDVELWTVADGPHVPALTAEFSTSVVDFLLSHPKPG